MAEREGFEPSMQDKPHTRLAGERLQPYSAISPGCTLYLVSRTFFLITQEGKVVYQKVVKMSSPAKAIRRAF